MGEKTEQATPKKLRDAKKKGQVAKSQDFPAAFTFIVSMVTTLYLAKFLFEKLSEVIIGTFNLITHDNLEQIITGLFYHAFYVIFICSVPIMLVVCIVGVLVNFLTTGPVFAPEVFKFDIKKFNLFENLKSKFKMKTMFELLKSLFKVSIAAILVYQIMRDSIPVLIQTAGMPLLTALEVFSYYLYEVIFKVGLFFIIVSVFDLMYQKHNFGKEMMMEKFEVKQEYKDSEGNPEIKGKRREIAREIAYSDAPGSQASRAKAVVTNPTHIAIAIDFDKEQDAAPYILVMGKDFLAEQIIKIAEEHKVPVVRNIPLAHKLWEEGKLYEYIPEDTYEAVADILRWIASLEGNVAGTDNEYAPSN